VGKECLGKELRVTKEVEGNTSFAKLDS